MIRYFAGHEKKLANNKRGGNFMKKIILAFGMVLATAFACFAASPAKDFDYHLMSQSELTDLSLFVNGLNTKGDFIEITGYNGRDSTVEIPAEIEGCKVIKVTIDGWSSGDKYVVPASVIWVYMPDDHGIPDVEFLRPKDAAFFWETSVLPTDEKLRERKIIFTRSGTSNVSLSLPDVETFTWSKNWSTCITGDMNFNIKPEYNSHRKFYLKPYSYDTPVEELIIEEGVQELPFMVHDCCEKLVLPKTLKIIRGGHDMNFFIGTISSDYHLTDIVIPAGAKIKIEPESIRGASGMSITTQKALKAQGYSW